MMTETSTGFFVASLTLRWEGGARADGDGTV